SAASAYEQDQQMVFEEPQEEDPPFSAMDPVLLKNTDFNASFIHVDDLGKTKPKSSGGKGVSFRTDIQDISRVDGSEVDVEELQQRVGSMRVGSGDFADYAEEQMHLSMMPPMMKPNFGSRGSSLKNLEQTTPPSNRASIVPDAFYRSQPPPHMRHASPQHASPQAPLGQAQAYQANNRVSQMPPQVAKSRSYEDGFVAPSAPSPMPSLPITAMAPRQMNIPPPPNKVPSGALGKPKLSEIAVQTENTGAGPVDTQALLAYIAELEAQLAASKQETEKQATLMQEQKRGFDKLSAQAYKKIKELLTDRNIMSIEIKSLKAQ
ncbi:hypothetical protein HDU91_003682, partial [Kappamyces sp. JEL0680]